MFNGANFNCTHCYFSGRNHALTMTSLLLAKVLIASPWISIGVVVAGIYLTAIKDSWDLDTLYDAAISNLGTTWSLYRQIFAIGFTISCSLIMTGGAIKFYLMQKYWRVTASLIVNLFLIMVGSSMLVLMAWSPYDIDWPLHYTGAIVGIALCLIAQLMDAINWVLYCKHLDSVDRCLYILTSYSCVCLLASSSFFSAWLQSSVDEKLSDDAPPSTPWCEWLGLLFAILGFLTQSAHGVCIHRYMECGAEYEMLAKSETEGSRLLLEPQRMPGVL